jgi:hormone-sensitive lipase
MLLPKDKKPFFSFFNKINVGTNKDTIFFHIHGGGFVGTSFINHEDYLRKWVNHCKIPLFSVNYCYSPENKYPKPLDDCWQAYNWLLEHSKEELGIDPKKIIICGDSAGGHLMFALTFLTIVHNIKVPDLIIAAFSCTDTTKYKMTPSLLLSLDDKYLSFEALKWINEAYRDNYLEEEDPFINPYKASELILKKMPKTLFFFGSGDPIRDENIRLISKMSNIDEIDLKVFEFKYYPHGLFGTAFKVFYPLPTSILFEELDEFLNKKE